MEIDIEDLKSGHVDGRKIAIVDIRDPWEVKFCVLPDSINGPISVLPRNIAALPRDTALAGVCHLGMRSLQAAARLRVQGFDDAVSLRGGIDARARRIDPKMATC